MLEQIILGIIQGVAEWLPVSSEGIIVLVKTNIFHTHVTVDETIQLALFLHFGTFLSALIYFRRDVTVLTKTLFRYKSQSRDTQKLLSFLLLTTIISGILGVTLIALLSRFTAQFDAQGKLITLAVGCLLLGTACLELCCSKGGYREIKDLKMADSILLGIAQGFAVLPGLSRSGLTVSALLLRKIDKPYALKLSFLMSLPIVFVGNIVFNLNTLAWSTDALVGLFFSFLFGLTTIHVLLKIAEKIHFGYFVLFVGILTILSAAI